MSLDTFIIVLGALLAILPFLGFPITWQHPIVFILGVLVIAAGIAARRRFNQRRDVIVQVSEEEIV